jgi:hypothetical protein
MKMSTNTIQKYLVDQSLSPRLGVSWSLQIPTLRGCRGATLRLALYSIPKYIFLAETLEVFLNSQQVDRANYI